MRHNTIFCGHGVNNFAALSAADVGFAVGVTEAIVAAAVMTRLDSVAGMCTLKQISMMCVSEACVA